MGATIRRATVADAEAVARIYNQGIEERQATFETRPRSAAELRSAIDGPGSPAFLVAECDGGVVGWARLGRHSDRDCYAGVGEASIYVDRGARGQGLGRRLFDALAEGAERDGYWKVVGLLFPTNAASLALCRSAGCREVGEFRHHGRLGGKWRDVMLVERLLGEALQDRAHDGAAPA
jgi:L-amino acid N-acyltransferase YncA